MILQSFLLYCASIRLNISSLIPASTIGYPVKPFFQADKVFRIFFPRKFIKVFSRVITFLTCEENDLINCVIKFSPANFMLINFVCSSTLLIFFYYTRSRYVSTCNLTKFNDKAISFDVPIQQFGKST